MNIEGIITSVEYKVSLTITLKEIDLSELDINQNNSFEVIIEHG